MYSDQPVGRNQKFDGKRHPPLFHLYGMLSAVAARKARLSANDRPSAQRPVTVQDENRDEPTHSKRKLSHSTSKSVRPKKQRLARREVTQAGRYFAQPSSFEDQDDSVASDDDEAISDSSDGDIWEAVEDRQATPSQVISSTLSTWRPVQGQTLLHLTEEDSHALQISTGIPARVFLLRKDERLTLVGVYRLTVVHGSVALAGTTLTAKAESHEVYAPWSSPLPVIECLPGGQTVSSWPKTLSEPLRQSLARFDAALVVQEFRTGIEGLGKVCRTFEHVFEPPRQRDARLVEGLSLSGVHYIESQGHGLCSFTVPPSWQQAVNRALTHYGRETTRLVYVVQGAKKTGKSSFARLLLNTLLTRFRKVAFLECDIGQSEFTPGGMLALNVVEKHMFGPPFSHPSIPYRAHYIGSTSPKDTPALYIEAINALVQSYIDHVQFDDSSESLSLDNRVVDFVPLVVNTMGWTKGLGADLSQRISEIVEPTEIFNTQAAAPKDGSLPVMPYVSTPGGIPAVKLTLLEPFTSTDTATRFTAADQRNISILSYLHAIFAPDLSSEDQEQVPQYASSWNTSLPLCARMPYEIRSGAGLHSIVLLGPGAEDIVPSEVGRVLNGSIVALVSTHSDVSVEIGKAVGLPYVQGATPPSPATSACHGLALIRSYDTDITMDNDTGQHTLHLLTPIPPPSRSHCLLVKGQMELPIWGWLDFTEDSLNGKTEQHNVPYLQWGKGEGVGAERRRIRRNLMRQALK
ncbi:hypothetical protein BDW22DRAFT_866481 [Trametopsis cervina]|nr:hypothetical protein BDW22DRAFT_866481 [Trametopsis cervina]